MSNIEMQQLQSGSTMLRSSTNISLKFYDTGAKYIVCRQRSPYPL